MSWNPPSRHHLLLAPLSAALAVAVLLVLFRASALSALPAGAEKTNAELDALEAVLRYQFYYNASSQRGDAKVFCLSLDGSDPDDAFMARFANHRVPVRKASDCNAGGNGVSDKATGVAGLKLNAGQATWIASDEIAIAGGYYEASLSASGNTFRVKKQPRGWTVVEVSMKWIS